MNERSPRTRALVAVTAAVAAALSAAGLASLAAAGPSLLPVAVLVAIAVLSFRTIRVFAHGELSLGDVAALVGALTLPVAAVAPLAALGALASEIAVRRPPLQLVRNVAALAVSAGAASLAYGLAVALLPLEGPAARVPAALVAAFVFVALDVVQTAALIGSLPRVPAEHRRPVWLWRTARAEFLWLLGAAIGIEIARVELLLFAPMAVLFYLGFDDDRERHLATRRARVLATLVDVSHAVGASLDTTEVFRAVYEKARASLEADAFSVALARNGVLSYRFLVDADRELPAQERARAGTLAGLAIEQDRPILLRDAERDRRALGLELSGWGTVSERSVIVAPLRIGGRAIGAISVQSVNANAYDEGDLELLGAIASEAALAIERAELHERTASLSRRLVQLERIGLEVSGERDLGAIVGRLVASLKDLLGASAVAVYLDDGGPRLEFAGTTGNAPADVRTLDKAGAIARALEEGPVEIADESGAEEDVRAALARFGHRAVVIYPLRAAATTVGVLFVTWREPRALEPDEREALDLLAGIGATAIRSARLYAELDEAYLSTVQTLMTTIQARDGYREDHHLRVAGDAVALGERLGLPEASLRDLRFASLFHTLGKIGVPQEILTKRAPLTADERRIVHEHPLLGARILEGIRFLRGVVPIVRSANERWDGSGYPEALAYEAIPYEARILQIVLSYHAMLADRPYRSPLAPRTALDELRLLAGSRYDPGLVDAFVKMIEERGVPDAVERQVQESARELTVLAEITPQFSTLLDIKQLLEQTLATLERHWRGSTLHIFLHDERTDEIVSRASVGAQTSLLPGTRLATRKGLARWAFEHRESALVDDARADPRAAGRDEHRSVMVVPLLSEGRAIGVLAVVSARPGTFGQRDLTLLQAVAAQIGAAIAVAELHERLKRAANTDALTGLHNYRYFYDRLEEEMSRAERRGMPLSIAYFDIDELKRVNDEHGHLAGDAVLRTLGSAVESQLRHEDVPARYGGDEFAIVMPETDREAAEKAVQRLMERLDSTTIEIADGRTIPMPRRSWGVASYPADGASAKELVEAADARAYARKRTKA
ncbi:MAG TPA: GAF domain-containing protein [Candidatus Limnocylindria bacterium]|nr:GAF domain-containing protein [Candidatus Limnocylindria bacterium]